MSEDIGNSKSATIENHGSTTAKVIDHAAAQKRIDYLYSLLTELRTGSVTYTDIVRRERFHPPVRKILMKLGVQKASEIKNDGQLYNVISDIVLKKAANNNEDAQENLGSNREEDLTDNNKSFLQSTGNVKSPLKQQERDPAKQQKIISSPSKERTSKAEDYATFRQLVLAVHSQNGRVRAALNSVKTSPHVSLERLIAVVNAVCAVAGTSRLFRSLSEAEVCAAFDTYWNSKKSKQGGERDRDRDRDKVQPASGSDAVEVATSAIADSEEAFISSPEKSTTSELDEPLFIEEEEAKTAEYEESQGLQIEPVDLAEEEAQALDASHSEAEPGSPIHSEAVMYIDSPEKPSSLADAQYRQSSFVFENERDPRFLDERTGRIRLDSGESTSSFNSAVHGPHSAPYPPSASTSALDYSSIYVSFWEKVFAMFFFVSNPYEPIDTCLCKVEDVIFLVESVPEFISPVIVLAIDVIVQRAMYELSDKVVRTSRNAGSDPNEMETISTVKDIDRCVSVMSTLVIPLCERLLKSFPLSDVPSIPAARFTEKVQTLSRQLQELTAWSSFHGQQKVRPTFPLSAKDAMKPQRVQQEAQPGDDFIRTTSITDIIDDNFKLYLKEVTPPGYLMTEVEKMRVKIQKLLSRQVSAEMTISLCGSVALGLADSELKLEADFVALIPPYNHNFYNLNSYYNKVEAEKLRMLREEYKEIEKAIEKELLAEYAQRHLKAASKDVRNVAAEFLVHIKNSLSGFEPKRGSIEAVSTLLQTFAYDLDAIVYAADEVIRKYSSVKQDKLRDSQGLSMMMKKLEIIQDMLDKSENEKNQLSKRIIKIVEKNLKEQGCVNVRPNVVKARFLQIKFTSHEAAKEPLHFNLIFNSAIPNQATELLSAYISLDRSGKIHDFFFIVKIFAKAHNICDSSQGFLSSFAWFVMALHVLLRYEFLPNIHSHVLLRDDEEIVEPEKKAAAEYAQLRSANVEHGVFKDFIMNPMHLPQKYVKKIESTSLLELLDIFFRYFVEVFEPFESVVTLKGSGEVLKKSAWRKNATLWRFSIEDPFEHVNSVRPYDLGSTLSRPGQLTTFKALRRAIYGIHSIMIMGTDMCRINIKKFFAKNDLIHLARRADYLGTIMHEPRVWTRQERSEQSQSEELQLVDRAIDFDLVYKREYLPRRMMLHCSVNDYLFDGAICASDGFDGTLGDLSARSFNDSDSGSMTDKSKYGYANTRPSTFSSPSSIGSQHMIPPQTIMGLQSRVNPGIAPSPGLVQAKSELDYHRKVNSSQPFRSQYHYQPPHPSQLKAAEPADPTPPPRANPQAPFSSKSQQYPYPSYSQPPLPQQQQQQQQQQPQQQQRPQLYSGRDSSSNFVSNQNQRRQPYQPALQQRPAFNQSSSQQQYPLQRFDLTKGGYVARPDEVQQYGDKKSKPFPYFAPRPDYENTPRTEVLPVDRDSSLVSSQFSNRAPFAPSVLSASSTAPGAPLSSRSESAAAPVKVVKDPRFKFATSVAPVDDVVGFDYDRLIASRATLDSTSGSGSLSARSNPPLSKPRQSSPFQSSGDHYSNRPAFSSDFSSSLDDYDNMLDAGSKDVLKPPLYPSLNDQGSVSGLGLGLGGGGSGKIKPFVPNIPLSSMNNRGGSNAYFDLDDSDINTTGRSNYSFENEVSARSDFLTLDPEFALPAKAPPKKNPVVPPISLAGIGLQSKYDFDEPLKSDRFLDLSSMQSDRSSLLGRASEPSFLVSERSASDFYYEDFNTVVDSQPYSDRDKSNRPWRPSYDPAAEDRAADLTATPRQSVTTHDSGYGYFQNSQADTPRTITPRIPSTTLSAPPGISAPSHSHGHGPFMSEFGASNFFLDASSSNQQQQTLLGYSSRDLRQEDSSLPDCNNKAIFDLLGVDGFGTGSSSLPNDSSNNNNNNNLGDKQDP